MKKVLVLIAVIILIAAGVFVYKKSHTETLDTAKVERGTIIDNVQAIGYIKPKFSNTVKSQVNGTVARIYHYDGEYVKKGEPLVKIKPEPEPTEYAAIHEALDEAMAVEKAAKIDYDRYVEAVNAGLVSKNYTPYIAAKKAYDTSKLQRKLAAQKLALLKKGTTVVAGEPIANIVTSPITGYILTRNVDIGDPVISISSAQSATSLFTMADMNNLMFEGSVDELDASKLHLNMPAKITIAALDKDKITGKLTKIGLQSEQNGAEAIDPNLPFNVSFKVEITGIKIPKGLVLRSGYSAIADVKIKTIKDILIIPERLVHFKDDKTYVLSSKLDKNKKPQKIFVTLGISDGMNVEIKKGLKLGQEILDQPQVDIEE